MKSKIEITKDVFFRNGESKPNYAFRPPEYLKGMFETTEFEQNPIASFLEGLMPNKILRVKVIVEYDPDEGNP
jgi:hypothetical protein